MLQDLIADKFDDSFLRNILIFDRDENQLWTSDTPNELTVFDGVTAEIWKLANGNG